MTPATGQRKWEIPAALAAAALCIVPLGPLAGVVRVPAGIALLCLLPGLALCRHALGIVSPLRQIVLGGVLSLCLIPAVLIPAALLSGRPGASMAAVAAALLTVAASLVPRMRAGADALPETPVPRPGSALALGVAALMQILVTLLKHPAGGAIRWKGLPDLMFFHGIYTQLTLHTPPLDPELGTALLVHNWIYHFHFACLHLVTGLSILTTMRLVSLWMALTLVGLILILAADVLRRPRAGPIAALLLMTGGEVYWIVRSAAHMGLRADALPWEWSPMGVTLLFGWYNLAPLAAGLAAWYWLERHRVSSQPGDLAVSAGLCAAMAFFHPVFFGVFMTGFCLWLIRLWIGEGARPAWLVYLATPLPFFLLYKIPYYGTGMPPSVVHAMSPAASLDLGQDLLLSWGALIPLALLGWWAGAGRLGPLVWIAGVSVPLNLLVGSPNPHWFTDLAQIALAMIGGAGVEMLWSRRRGLGVAVLLLALVAGGLPLALHLRRAVSVSHVFSADERAAAAWIRARTGPDDLIAILPDSPSSYTIHGLAHRRLVHGWTGHLLDFHHDARQRASEVTEIFTSGDPQRAAAMALGHGARYVYLGPREREVARMSGLQGGCFQEVFAAGEVSVLAVTCAEGSAAASGSDP